MKLIEIKATGEKLDIKKNTLTYTSDVDAAPGILLQADKSGEKGVLIVNQIHEGGPVNVIMKPFNTPAKKYAVGEVVAVLMVNGKE